MGTQPLGQMIIELGLDSSNFSRGMKGVSQQIKTATTEMKAHLNVIGRNGSELDKLKAKQTGLSTVLAAQNTKVSLAKEKYEACKAAVEGNTQATQQQKDALIRAQNEYTRAIGELGSYENQLREVNIRLTAMETGLYKTGTSLVSFGSNLTKVGDATAKVGKALVMGITAPILALGTHAVKTAAEFDAAMSKVSAVSGATGTALDMLKDKAREMGEKTKFSATDSAEAMNYMAMAGWKTVDMLDGIEGIMNLAAASGENLATTSDIVTDALTGFGKTAKDAGHLADIMAAASSNSNTNVAMMGETFKYCTPIAGALGFSMEDTAEAIGLMANSGIKASMAGTAMRAMMNNLASEVKLSGEKIGEMTIQTQKNDGSMRNLNDILGDCREAFSQMSEAEQVANAKALVGERAMSGFIAVMNAAPSDIQKLNEAITGCGGEAERMAGVMRDNLQGQLNILKSKTDELAISFGNILMPKIDVLVQGAQNIVDKFNSLNDETKNTIVNIGLFSAVVGPAVLIVGKLTSGIGTLITGVGKGMQSFALWAAKITNTTVATAGQTAATVSSTAATQANTAVNGRNTASLLAKTAKTIADAAASKAHAAVEKVRSVVIAAGNGTLTAQVAALNASIISKVKNTAATTAHTIAEKTSGLVIGISTAGLSLQTVATVAQTVAANSCAVATGLLSAAIKLLLGPVGWVIAAITLLVTGVIAAVKWLNRETEASKQLKGETEELAKANEELVNSIDTSKSSYDENIKSIEAETETAGELAEKVIELSKAEGKSVVQKKELKAYVDMLNSSVEGLNLKYSEEADALSMTTDEIYGQITAMELRSKKDAAMVRQAELTRERAQLEEQLVEVQKKVTEAEENSNLKRKEKKEILKELTAQETQLKEQLVLTGDAVESVTETVQRCIEADARAAAENSQTILEAYGSIKNAYDDLGQHQKQALDDITNAYEVMSGRLSSLSEKIELDSETTWAKIRENQQDTIEKTKEFSEMYAQLMEAGVSESYLKAIGATGPESIPLLKDMMSQGADAVLQSQKEWEEAYGVIGNTLTDSLKLDESVKTALKSYILGETGVFGTLQGAIDGADLNALGKGITEGLSKGIIENTENAEKASAFMVGQTEVAAKEKTEMNSPSKVFARIGGGIVEGLVLGLKQNENKAYAKAAEIAGNVTKITKAALGIHSPSAVMRDEVGKNIALGIAEGITQNKDYATKSAEEIADAVVQEARKRLDNTKVYTNLTLADEAAYWDSVRKQVAEGTQARIDADKQYFQLKKSLTEKMGSIEESYTSKVSQAYEKLNKDMKSLRDTYDNEFTNRTKDLMGAMGLFDEFTAKTELTTDDLIGNLKTQVTGLEEWSNNLDVLEKRGIGGDLLKELQEMGTGAAGEVELLTQMTEEELQEYLTLFKQKQRLAKAEASKELQPLLRQTEEQIAQMRATVSSELDGYKNEFIQAMSEIGAEIQTPLQEVQSALTNVMSSVVQLAASAVSIEADKNENQTQFGALASTLIKATENLPTDFNTIGVQTTQGLIQGIQSKSGELYQAMSAIIKEAINAVRNEAQIHSPSRVMMSLGSYMIQGFGIGMENMQGYVKKVAGETAATVSDAFNVDSSNITMFPEIKTVNTLTDNTGAVVSINRALNRLNNRNAEPDHKKESTQENTAIFEKLLMANERMIKLLEMIADKDPIIDKRSMTDVVDAGLEGRRILKGRWA